MATLADFPQLVAQLDPEKNGPLAPESIAAGSHRKLWWRCTAGPDHQWEGPVNDRTRTSLVCPFCVNRRVSVTNALSTLQPAAARRWHPTKNGHLRPCNVVATSHRSVWWKCPAGPDHAWQARIMDQCDGKGCPFCAGKRPSKAHNLAVVAPATADQWHPTRNGELLPEDVTPWSGRVFWWRCSRGHEWSASGSRRATNGCPFCSGSRVAPDTSLSALCPDLARQWHPVKNGVLTPGDVTVSARRHVWWKCPEGPDHEWQKSVAGRRAGAVGCPFCAGYAVSVTNSLATQVPGAAARWHPTKNGDFTPHDVTIGSDRRAWWRCTFGHAWEAPIKKIVASHGCPFCANKRVSPTNSLAARFPRLAREWHPTKNGELTPRHVVAGTNRKVWWRCAFGHEWQAVVDSRARAGAGCLACHQLGRKRAVATTRGRRGPVRLAGYNGAHHGPVRRVK